MFQSLKNKIRLRYLFCVQVLDLLKKKFLLGPKRGIMPDRFEILYNLPLSTKKVKELLDKISFIADLKFIFGFSILVFENFGTIKNIKGAQAIPSIASNGILSSPIY